MNKKVQAFLRRKHRTNTVTKSLSLKPRLIVSRSNKHIHAQVIDRSGAVVACAYDNGIEGTKKEKAFAVGKAVASLAKTNGVTEVVFDRNGYLYHGRVAQVAEGARQEGLVF